MQTETDNNKASGQRPLAAAQRSTAPLELKLTPREELAVVCQRLKTHIEDTKDETSRIKLDIAHDLIRSTIHRR